MMRADSEANGQGEYKQILIGHGASSATSNEESSEKIGREVIFESTSHQGIKICVRIEVAAHCVASVVWPACSTLAQVLCDGRMVPSIKDCRVLELGAGAGLTAAVAAQLGASFVVATELPEGMELLRRNLEANALPEFSAIAETLTWGSRSVPDRMQNLQFDVVMGADITYVREMLQPLMTSILQFAAPDATVIIAHSTVHKVSVDDVRHWLEEFFDVALSFMRSSNSLPEVAVFLARRRTDLTPRAVAQHLQNWFNAGCGDRVYSSHQEMLHDAWGEAPTTMPADEHGPLLPTQSREPAL